MNTELDELLRELFWCGVNVGQTASVTARDTFSAKAEGVMDRIRELLTPARRTSTIRKQTGGVREW